MANWDFVFPYNEEMKAWLAARNYPSPPILEGNRLPLTADIKWSLEQQVGFQPDYPASLEDLYVHELGTNRFSLCLRGFNWDHAFALPSASRFMIRSMSELQCSVLACLSQRCGQLLMWPDTGLPAIIFEAGTNARAIHDLWKLSTEREDDQWSFFFERMYGS